ncbi:NADH-ubiquinone oxidoreductase subunit E family protein [Campylobacter geochelonis]|uniref:NADH-ubiquinone oxidoreductase chain E n=1 Tax=Campylobacter geochelonis TaxID=1780362 RepID=A0A128EPJ0_9BACT|nr:NADH-ubiquinone oxidoreductase subunit E family protein [Campylobacter geochelonis]QKF70543.1 putative NADH:quinone oxidoreductase I chain E (cl24924 superfamily) [Campylobacter geochelonis]CZE46071.1 NADH-ubiquinone oxidoreductase chain E [Campylobacter geochelonis]CZE46563.1 NADH-ubiquinone oxidoreductase chain E [Campylobacter geochelonis]CZE50415.1 NADH-ubiquinone oxidoreductase chain E [Campylobacter geochelonis]
MKRYDLRHLKENFLTRMGEIIRDTQSGEVMIFIFEIGDFSSVQKSADLVAGLNSTLMNSLKFNQVDWTIVVKKGNL